MEPSSRSTSNLFQVFLRLRPPPSNNLYPSLPGVHDRFLTVEEATTQSDDPTHITIIPPNDNRRRAVEKFAFTRVFEEDASQLDIFNGTGVIPLVDGVLGAHGGDGRDGLLATLGVTGSGKSHTILGSRSQRGLTQLALDVLFRSIEDHILDTNTSPSLHATIAASDPSEAQVLTAQNFLDGVFTDPINASRPSSRAPTPMIVRSSIHYSTTCEPILHQSSVGLYPSLPVLLMGSPIRFRSARTDLRTAGSSKEPYISFGQPSTTQRERTLLTRKSKGETMYGATPSRRLQRPSAMPNLPDVGSVLLEADSRAEYAIVISMYEVYNDRIFDLLTPAARSAATKEYRRRPLLFKSTEQSPDRKVVAGLRKIICNNAREALLVLEAGLHERRVAGTGSNSVSSRSHGFFCVEVKKRRKGKIAAPWSGSTLTIVDLAGSERARDAKTQGATLAEAGKINESLMYLGQCLQMQSDATSNTRPNLVPFRQCKLTELLFSNSFPSQNHHHLHRPQKAVMIVTADPNGDFNATSQILRYSALAREITVPRVPSVTSTILGSSASSNGSYSTKGTFSCGCGRSTPSETERETMEIAALEIARMSEEIDGLRAELAASQEAHMETTAHLLSAEERLLDIEMEVRDSVFAEMESRMEHELRRWKARLQDEADRADEHVDRKLEVLMKGMNIDDEDKENVSIESSCGDISTVDALQDENAHLRAQVLVLQRELQQRSPAKGSRVLQESRTEPSTSLLRTSPSPRSSPQPGRSMPRSPLARMAYEENLSDDDNEVVFVSGSATETRNMNSMPGAFEETPTPGSEASPFIVHDDENQAGDASVFSSSVISFQSADDSLQSPARYDDDDDDDIFRPQNHRLATLKGSSKESTSKPKYKLRSSSSAASLRPSSNFDRESLTPRNNRSHNGSSFPADFDDDLDLDYRSLRSSTLRSSTVRGSTSSTRFSGAQTVSRASQVSKERERNARGSSSSSSTTTTATKIRASKLSTASASAGGSPVKRVRKLAAKRWEMGNDDDEF